VHRAHALCANVVKRTEDTLHFYLAIVAPPRHAWRAFRISVGRNAMSSGRFAILVDGQRRSTPVSLCAALALSACAAAPGMRISDAAMQASGGDTEKPPEILPITLKLNEELRKNAKPTNVGVEQLFGTPQPYRIGPGDIISVVVWITRARVSTQTYSVATAMEIPSPAADRTCPATWSAPAAISSFHMRA
jgi:polysaccharide export outer membrane protein